MNVTEIRQTPTAELVARKKELERERFDLRIEAAVESSDGGGSRLAALRKEVARINTIMRERVLAEQGPRPSRTRVLYRRKKRDRAVKKAGKKS